MQINSATQSIQLLKAQQALEARRMANKMPSAVVPSADADSLSNVSISRDLPETTSMLPSPQWSRKLQDIQQVAAKAGFVGLSEQDIQQAYLRGESLLADYRV